MRADAYRKHLFGKVIEVTPDDHFDEGLEVGGPAGHVARVLSGPNRKLLSQLEQPRPAVRSLKGLAIGAPEIRSLSLHMRLRQMIVEDRVDLVFDGESGIRPEQSDQHPMGMDRRVPIKATVEGRVELARALDIRCSRKHVSRRIGIFPGHAFQRDRCQHEGDALLHDVVPFRRICIDS